MMKSNSDFFHGTVLKNSEIAGLTLTETAYPPQLRLSKHEHQSAYFCYVLQGGFTEVYGNRSLDCGSTILIFHPAGETHADSFYAASRCFNLEINAQWIDRIQKLKPSLSEPAHFRKNPLSHLALKLYREFCNQDELSPLVIEGLTLEILGGTARRQSSKTANNPPHWLVQAWEFLNDRFQENLAVAEIARAVGVHETHLSREFRRYYGLTIGEHIRHLRVEYACRELSVSARSLAEIALAAGFFDQSHLTRTFKSQTGMTPREYRSLWRTR